MNKKGFTMVELLAVIVILGVLGTIGVVATNKYLVQSREKSYKIMSQTLYEATMNCMIQGKCATPTKTMAVTYTSGKLVELGYIDSMKNPRSSGKDCDGKVTVLTSSENNIDYKKYTYTVSLKCEGVADTTIQWPEAKTDETLSKITEYSSNTVKSEKTYNVGDSIKLNPLTGLLCESGDYCYTWYVIKKSNPSDSKLFLILNKNIGDPVQITSEINYLYQYQHTADYANNYLKDLTSGWKYQGRLIKKQEIIDIIGIVPSDHYLLNNYSWLAENIDKDNYNDPYWIDAISTGYAWKVGYYTSEPAIFTNQYIAYNANAQKLSVRPVIEVDIQ